MLLDRIDVSKSSGQDKHIGRLLQSQAKEITPVVHFIFTQSLCTCELPTEWTQANVAPILKKSSQSRAVNYRSVFLKCITCKLFGHRSSTWLQVRKIMWNSISNYCSGPSSNAYKKTVKLTFPF